MGVASPLSTGGAGPDFETEVRVSYLVALLTGSVPRGAAGGTTVEVVFQQAAAGAPLDDVVVRSRGSSGATSTLELQVKHRFTFAPSDANFNAILQASWDTYTRRDFLAEGSRLGVAAGQFPERVRSHYMRVPTWANTSTSASHFFDRIRTPRLASDVMRAFVETVRAGLEAYAGALPDTSVWDFFRRMVILEFDFGIEGSRDRQFAVEALRSLIPDRDPSRAQSLYDRLIKLASDAGHTAGGYTGETLRESLVGSDLLAPPSCWADLSRINEASTRTLQLIDDCIGGVVLDRTSTVSELLDRMEGGGVVALIGDAGVGKSALLKTAALSRAADGPVLALSPTRLQGIVGWEGLSSRWQLNNSLERLILAMSGTGRPCLVIDGVDRIDGPGERDAVNDLLTAITRLPRARDGTPPWTIVLTTRGETLSGVRDWLHVPITTENLLRVPELGDEEANAISVALPHLREVLQRTDVGPVVRNLYFLRIFERARAVGDVEPVPAAVTETDVHFIWWNRVIGAGGAEGRARQTALLELGEEALRTSAGGLRGAGLDPRVLHDLEGDHVLRYDSASDTYRFAHDIVEDWTIARTFGRHDNRVAEWLQSLGEPFRAYLPLQFFACALLEREDGLRSWQQLLQSAEQIGPDRRWRESVITAPFRSARLAGLLELIGPTLLADDGVRLNVFLRAVRTVGIEPDPALRSVVMGQGVAPAEGAAVLMELALPIWRIWIPTMEWLIRQLPTLPSQVRSEASHLMLIWQRTTAPGVPWRREIGEVALQWWRGRVAPDGRYVFVPREIEPYFDRLRDTVVFSADAIPKAIPGFLKDVIDVGRGDRIERWLAERPHRTLAKHTPKAYADFALELLLPRRGEVSDQESDAENDPDIVSNYAYVPASHLQGPFLVLIREHEAEGLRVINTLVNVATAAEQRRQHESEWARLEHVSVPFFESPKAFLGDIQMYLWFRPLGGAPYAVESALMALEVWMEEQVAGGRDPEALFRTVLSSSESIATVAVCVSVCLAHPDRCLRAAAPFVCTAALWHWDIARASHDRMDLGSSFAFTSPRPELDRLNAEHNRKPHRRWDIRALMPHYLFFTGDRQLRERVMETVRGFPTDLTRLGEQDRTSEEVVREFQADMAIYAAWADPANYRVTQRPEGVEVEYIPPPAVVEPRADERQAFARWNRDLGLVQWANKSWSQGDVADGMSLEEALSQVRAAEQPDDFSREFRIDHGMNYTRTEAICAVAAVAVRLSPEWLHTEDNLAWCRRVLVSGASIPREPYQDVGLPDDPAVWSARGLSELVRNGHGDAEIREALIRLSEMSSSRILEEAVTAGVRTLWSQDPVLGKNIVARELALATVPHAEWSIDPAARRAGEEAAEAYVRSARDRCVANVRDGRLPTLSLAVAAGSDRLHTGHVARAFRCIPLERIIPHPGDRAWVLGLTDASVRWTISVLEADAARDRWKRGHSAVIPSWLGSLGEWLARLTTLLSNEEVEEHVMAPVRVSWPASAALTASFMDGYISRHLATFPVPEEAQARWRALARWVTPPEQVSGSRWHHLSQDEEEAHQLVIFVRYGYCQLTKDWMGAVYFLDTVDQWVATLAHRQNAFRALLMFLQGPGRHVPPERIVCWLAEAMSGMEEPEVIFAEDGTGEAVAQELARAWLRGPEQIRGDEAVAVRYVKLLDRLITAGVRLAGSLRVQFR